MVTRAIAENNPPVAITAFSHRAPFLKEVCKTEDRTPSTADKDNYDYFYYELLIYGVFIFVNSSSSRKNRFKIGDVTILKSRWAERELCPDT